MSIFYLGQLVDLPSLNGILLGHGITSNTHQNQYNNLCKRLTNKKIRLLFEYIFAHVLESKLVELSAKSDSTSSKDCPATPSDRAACRMRLPSVKTSSKSNCWIQAVGRSTRLKRTQPCVRLVSRRMRKVTGN